ncbi:MAG: DUF6352 family protein, partial [Alphaproteobacteria bacterium]
EFLKVYLARPELAPPPEACAAERALHAALLASPRRPVAEEEIAALADADARENWGFMIRFRDRLLAHRTIEGAYLGLAREAAGTPPIFLAQLVHVILRNALDGTADAAVARAAELFFRTQRVGSHDGALIAADEETVDSASAGGPHTPLMRMFEGTPFGEVDVLGEANAAQYWARSDRYDMALDLTAGRRGHAALGEAIQAWVRHLLAVEVTVEPLVEVREAKLSWYVGLDADASRIGDALWHGEPLDEATAARVAGLWRLTFADPAAMLARVAGEPVYLILAATPDGRIRMKPQNLIAGLPLAERRAS